ncbi:MAG TPA: addiction module protein [Salinimicrobium sp.]|nr:addiction module protein [Salinimicrobium sp.]
MEMNGLKIELLQKVIACDDMEILKKIEQILNQDSFDVSEVEETKEEYETAVNSSLNISEEQKKELDKRYQDYLDGKGNLYDWEYVKANIQKKYGF